MTWQPGATRRERIQSGIRERQLDALLALTPENATYLSGQYNYIATHWRVPGLFSAVTAQNGDTAVVSGDFGLDPLESPKHLHVPFLLWTESVDVRGVPGNDIASRIVAARPESIARPNQFDLDQVFDRIASAVHSVAPAARRVGLELNMLPAAALNRLTSRLRGVEFVEAADLFDDLRVIKDPDEIALLRLACELTEIGIAGAIQRISPGQTGPTVNSHYQIAVHEQVASDPTFAAFRQAEGVASVGFGIDSPGVVGPGQTVKFDMQVDMGGYHSDVGRTVVIAPTEDQVRVYEALRGALEAARSTMRPGVAFSEVHSVATRFMQVAGFLNYSRGHLGHSVGLTQNFEEPPFIAPDEPRAMAPGMVLSLELPYYIYGVGAFQLERMVLITDHGHETIDTLPLDLPLLR